MILSKFFLTDVLVYFFAGIAAAIPALLLNIRLARPLGLIDWPKARGVTEDQVPIVGLSLVALTLGAMMFLGEQHGISSWLICTAAVIAVMGMVDDRRPLGAIDKIFLQVICAIVVVSMDPGVRGEITTPFGLVGAGLAVVFIVGLTNAFNFIDGIDGLAGVVLFFGLGGLVAISGGTADAGISWISALVMGMLIPFFYLNVFRRRGFLGNTGSYFFSFLAAVLHLSIPAETSDPVSRLSIAALCFIVPISDACMVISARILSLRSPFQADKGHLHHRLVQSSIPLRFILLNFALVATVSTFSAVFVMRYADSRSGHFPLFLCVGNVVITSLLILFVERASRLRIYGYFKRLDLGEPIYYMKYRLSNKDGRKLQAWQLRRVEALVSSEIRVTDLCVAEAPDTLFITLRTMPEPLKGISFRLDAVFQGERVLDATVIESGEFVKTPKVSRSIEAPRLVSHS